MVQLLGEPHIEGMRRAGVPGQALGRVVSERASEESGGLRAEIASAKATLTREISVAELRRELQPIAQGEARNYDEQEHAAAAFILKQIKGLEANAEVCVDRNVRNVLQTPQNLREQVREVERVQERSHDRGIRM